MRLQIRSMPLEEIDLALDWAAAEGWNPGLQDAVPFRAADPEGFLIGQIDDTPVAIISAVRYAESFGFIGFYIVHPAWRGQGHGWAIWQAAMARLAGRTIGLDGVPAQQDNYRRSGFEPAGAERLFTALRADVAGEEPVFLDIPACHPAAVALVERHGWRPVFETARMYAGPAPQLDLARIYGVTSFELG